MRVENNEHRKSPPIDDETERSIGRRQVGRVGAAFGASVREMRQARHFTQAELAEALWYFGIDLHQSQVAKIESGARPTTIQELWALSTVLEVDYDDLMPSPPGRERNVLAQAERQITHLMTEKARAERTAEIKAKELHEAESYLASLRLQRGL